MVWSNKGPWQCFHCGFVAKTLEEGEAHFGDVGGLPPLCMTWADMSEKTRISAFQQLELELAETRAELKETEAKLGYALHTMRQCETCKKKI